MNYQGIEDNYLPSVPKPSLQQYDNYQIHNLYCRDRLRIDRNQFRRDILFKKFLAVEAVSPYGSIDCNFNEIVSNYP